MLLYAVMGRWLLPLLFVTGACGGTAVVPPCDVTKHQLLAFPGAEGFGARATGGRGGRVIKVTNLSARGPGSLQEALDEFGPRIIVFDVSGVIEADIEIPYGDVTIAGQSAPGAGITILGTLYGGDSYAVENIIVRHIRVRPRYSQGDGETFDAMRFEKNSKLMFDHISVSYGVDEVMDLFEAQDVTVQWSTIESGEVEGHPEGIHNYGLLNGTRGGRITVHHSLFAHHRNRAPALAQGPAEVINNVIYNVRHAFQHHNPAAGVFHIYGNYLRRGRADQLFPFYFDDENGFRDASLSYYLADNIVDVGDRKRTVENPWKELAQPLLAPERLRAPRKTPMEGACHVSVSTEGAQSAFESVLRQAGAFPRDALTRKNVRDTRERTGEWGAWRPETPLEGLLPGVPATDSDGDGMPDEWERARGLAPNDPADVHRPLAGGYPAIETYLNERADELVRRAR